MLECDIDQGWGSKIQKICFCHVNSPRVTCGVTNKVLSIYFSQIKVEKVIVHERYREDSWHISNDIALVRLAEPAKLSVNVIPVCLPLDKVCKRNFMEVQEDMHEFCQINFCRRQLLIILV